MIRAKEYLHLLFSRSYDDPYRYVGPSFFFVADSESRQKKSHLRTLEVLQATE
jgi:hypothetical protein